MILVEDSLLPWGKEIHPFAWTIPEVYQYLYRFPASWTFIPTVYPLDVHWQDKLISGDKIILNHQNLSFYVYWNPERIVDFSQIIFLEKQGNHLVRRHQPLVWQNRIYPLKPFTETQNFRPRPLAHYLIKNSYEPTVFYLKNK